MSFDDDWGHEAGGDTMEIMAWQWDFGRTKLQLPPCLPMSTESQHFPCLKLSKTVKVFARHNRLLPNLSKKYFRNI